MAAKSARPGRTLVVFFLGLAIAYGLVAVAGLSWKPELGLDLQGGTRITLIAEGNPSADNLEQARKIIDQRVNGSGVSEAEVVTQGGRFIVVEIPGKTRRDLVETVERQAQLRFRLVACTDRGGIPCGAATTPTDPTAPTVPDPGTGVTIPPTAEATPTDGATDTPTDAPTDAPAPSEEPTASGTANRPGVSYGEETPSPTADPSDAAHRRGEPQRVEPAASPRRDDPSEAQRADRAARGRRHRRRPADLVPQPQRGGRRGVQRLHLPDRRLAHERGRRPEEAPGHLRVRPGDRRLLKYLLSAAMIEGTELDDAAAEIPQGQVNYVVTLDFDGDGHQDLR